MRAFIVLSLLVAAASAASLNGYNYGQGLSSGIIHSDISGNIQNYNPGSGLIDSIGGSSGLSGNRLVSSSGGIIDNISVGGSSGLIGSRGTNVINLNAVDSIPQTVEYSKQFFHFTAPEEEQDSGVIRQQLSNVLKKNLQVVFIKAPENNAATNAALQLAKQAIEQKTAIYVLTKQNDANQVIGRLQQIQENIPTTPEVRFIKYRTPEDLQYAKQVIQSQYNSAGGTSQNIDGGVAPVLNYASNSGHANLLDLGGSAAYNKVISGVAPVNTVISGLSTPNYLPPILKK